MKTIMKKERIIATAVTILFILSLIGIGFYYRSNNVLKTGLNKERLKSESLLSEKLALSKEIEKLKGDILNWQGKSEESDRLLAEANEKLKQMENTLARVHRDNANVAALKKELNELRQIRKDLEDQLAALEAMNRSNAEKIAAMEAELAAVKTERDELKTDLAVANTTDDFRVESRKGKKKNKLTVNSARTKQIMVSFEIPESMTKGVKFDIVTPSGETIKSDDKDLAYEVVDDGRNLTASLSPYSGEFEISRRIEMTYSPQRKLDSGVYKIRIYHNNRQAGSCQVRLR